MHVRDLNFVLKSEIFVHSDGQLWASHLILSCNPVYYTWKSFSQALLVDNPLLSYIDEQHANLLPPSLTLGKAWDFGPRIVKVESLVPLRDASTETISRNYVVHKPVEELQAQVQVEQAEQAATESVNSSEVEAD